MGKGAGPFVQPEFGVGVIEKTRPEFRLEGDGSISLQQKSGENRGAQMAKVGRRCTPEFLVACAAGA